ncbi:MAG: hypothetical protein CMP14_00995 [Rickettsiales bacterium]|nr:hypothetical protein [Rickettsiales bacterium]
MNFSALSNLSHRLKLACSLPSKLVMAKLAKRLPWLDKRKVRIAEIVHSPKDRHAGRLLGFYQAQENFLIESEDWLPIDFSGKNVLEIGPGPLGGMSLMAIFRGAKQVYGIEPDWVDGVLMDPVIEEAFLRPHYQVLTEAFGDLMDYFTFRSRITQRLRIDSVGLSEASPCFVADITLSNSCLEHIVDLPEALTSLANHTTAETRHIHLVNFGNHRNREAPFNTIYEMPPDEYRLKYGEHINLLRASEVQAACESAGLSLKMAIVDRPLEMVETVVLHSYWRERYEKDDLAVRTALYFSPMRKETEGLIS